MSAQALTLTSTHDTIYRLPQPSVNMSTSTANVVLSAAHEYKTLNRCYKYRSCTFPQVSHN